MGSPRVPHTGNSQEPSPELTFVHITPYRIVLCARGLGRIEVFRDEMSPADWARLRRDCLMVRPAQRAD